MLKRREQAICKCCGQRLLIRHGVQLPPLLADLLDMIERCPGGISCATLAGIFYPDKSDFDGRQCVHVNVHHLNVKLAETDLQVRAPGYKRDSAYRIIKRRNP